MAEIRLPLSIVYETEGVTPVSDIIVALQAANEVSRDVVSLLPSFFEGLKIEASSLNVRSLTQESPLREYFLLALTIAFQDDLKAEVPPMIEDFFNVRISENYDTLVTVIFMIVIFYGASLAVDGIKKAFTKSLPKAKLDELIQTLALETGRPAQDIRDIVEAKFEKPAATKRLLAQVGQFFLPSQKSKNAPVRFDRDVIPSETIRDIPYLKGGEEAKQDFSRYKPHAGVELELHAQDRDKAATGWAAVAPSISPERLKVRVVEPVKPSDLWQRDRVTADVVVVEKLTANGYQPSEIQITAIAPDGTPT
jgi:hypothetical protein